MTKEDLEEELEDRDEVLSDIRDILDDPDFSPFERLKQIEEAISEWEDEDEA